MYLKRKNSFLKGGIMFNPRQYVTVDQLYESHEYFELEWFDEDFLSLWGNDVALYCFLKNRKWADTCDFYSVTNSVKNETI